MATPSAKPGATPTHLTSSPHPTSAPLRSIAHKSPSTRTPAASAPGYAAQNSISSQAHQYATPLAVPGTGDDPVNFSSPSALLALGSFTGISPAAMIQENIPGHNMTDGDMQTMGIQGMKLERAVRDSNEEQRRRIQDVVQCLQVRVAGRGVSREGIERLSQLEGFDSLWGDNNLNIAGNFVDLEIDFYPGQDVVKDVSLRYATPDYQEGERRDKASEVLKRNLVQSLEDVEHGRWRSLQAFHDNLHWLRKLDKFSQQVNCFEALEGLETNFQRIWSAEGKTEKYGGEYEHLCAGIIGRPSMHKGTRIGLGLEYWVEQAKVLDAKTGLPSEAMAVDQAQGANVHTPDEQQKIWTVMVECEEGYPSLRISKEWVGSDVFTNDNQEPSEGDVHPKVVKWLDPPQTMRLSHGDHPDPMALDSSMLESTPPNRRFVARLDPPLHVPILAASEIYRHMGMQLPPEFKMFTYDSLVASEGAPTDAVPQPGRRRCRKPVETFDSSGSPYTNYHDYTFQAFESVAGRTIRDLPFSHPRQIAEVVPVFRQYALMESLIREVTSGSLQEKKGPRDSTNDAALGDPTTPNLDLFLQNDTITLCNDDPNEEKLSNLFGDDFSNAFSGSAASNLTPHHTTTYLDDVRVEVTLRTPIGQAPALMLLVTDSKNFPPGAFENEPVQVSLSFEVGLNGRITVIDAVHVGGSRHEGEDTEMQGADPARPSLYAIREKLAQVLEISQNLGILVEWVLRWLRKRAASG
ncbi:hypothetical protein N7539_006261 [Penicillium diatomitis]|uniref:Mediator of RNA polymerase II transcription subunit 1 n=1 Tax=Penicillium diatomitis TaxID=2819901 RepID=A0A9X0BT26_9EURO|nr:uncharacterized protein N7539_006261 [Penicillium diatomitis]KAJ5482815.1 hypothetical protein N7539_006261 [Penicillium diatomitis]